MHWLWQLFLTPASTATCILVLAVVVAVGLAVGKIQVAGVRLGVAGVLFSGLAFGHFGFEIDHAVLDFVREFGLALFVYAVGLAVGPGLWNALRSHGLRLNLLAAGIVVMGAALTVAIHYVCRVAMPLAVGLYSGATTNTPSMAAASQVLADYPPPPAEARRAFAQVAPELAAALPSDAEMTEADRAALAAEVAKMPGLAYAVAYPFGIVGIILTMIAVRRALAVDVEREAAASNGALGSQRARPTTMTLRVTNPNLAGRTLAELPAWESLDVVVSRHMHAGLLSVARHDRRLAVGDLLLAVGTRDDLDQLRIIVGEQADVDLGHLKSRITTAWLVVTHRKNAMRRLDELRLVERFGVQITRVRRAEIELPVTRDLRLDLADEVLVVGEREAIERVAKELGHSPKDLDRPDLLTVFVGLAAGVILGNWPFHVYGIPVDVKLGLAAGPLIVAIVVGHLRRIGPLVWYLSPGGSHMIREFGIAIFLAAVGLKSGDRFLETLTHGQGFVWMALAAVVTLVPLALAAAVARLWLAIPYLQLVGVLAGSMTDPPALAFANAQAKSEIPSVAYASVYPLCMILRVVSAQVMLLVFP